MSRVVVHALVAAVVAAVVAAALPPRAEAGRVVTGVVVDAATGAPVAGATVVVGQTEATTSATGEFRVEGADGRADLLVIASGYAVEFGKAGGGTVTVRLMRDGASSGSEVIEVSGEAPPGPAVARMSREEMRTMPGAGNDVLRSVQSLPGVARTPFGAGGLALRGTAPRDTHVFLDGIEVPLLYHFGGLASFVPTGFIEHLDIQASGFGARYGRGQGGVVVLESKTGNRDGWGVAGEVSMLHAAALAEGPAAGGSWSIGFRRSYVDAVLAAAQVDLTLAPRYFDTQLRWESRNRRWTALAFGSDDRLMLLRAAKDAASEGMTEGVDASGVAGFSYRSRFVRAGVRYRRDVGAGRLSVTPWLGVEDVLAFANHKGVNKGMQRWSLPAGLRAEAGHDVPGGAVSVGLDARRARYAYDINNTPPPSPGNPSPNLPVRRIGSSWATDVGAWTEGSWSLFDDHLEITPGLRVDYFGLSDEVVVDPRLTVTQHVCTCATLHQSIGVYHQPPLAVDFDPVFGDHGMCSSYAVQASSGVKAPVGSDVTASVTGYAQVLRDLPVDVVSGATPISANGNSQAGGLLAVSRELIDDQFGSYSYRENVGRGRAWGVETVLRREAGAVTGWLSYTYARSLRLGADRVEGYLPYVLDQPHMLTAVGSWKWGAWRFGGRIRFASGNPFTPVASSYQKPGSKEWTPVDGALLSERLPVFIQVDARVDRSWRRSWGTMNLFLDLQNATNRLNAEGVVYSDDYARRANTHGLPIFPSFGVEYLP